MCTINIVKKISLIAISLILITSCAVKRPTGKTDAEVLYKEALQMVEDKRYILATEKLNTLRSQYPYSFYATGAELLLADILYQQESFVESAAAYILFRDFHPKHEKINYVIWRIAESYYNQIPSTFDRDLSAAQEAVKYYQEILYKYPKFDKAGEAKEKIAEIKDLLVKKQKYIADFYFRTEVYDAAIFRYERILEKFREEDIRLHSMKRIVLSSYEIKDFDKCLTSGAKYLPYFKDGEKQQLSEILEKCKAQK